MRRDRRPLAADLLLAGGRVVSVLTGELFEADVAIAGDRIAGVLPPGTPVDAAATFDASGLLIAPGFVDSHLHVESSFLTPGRFAAATLPHGTTTVLADPHEIVNVAGADGLRWMAEAAAGTPQTILFGVPSCVPALPGFETAGAELGPADVEELLRVPGVVGLGEVMDYRAVIAGDPRVHAIVRAAREAGVLVDGHCPGISGADLSAYLAAGIDSDHTKNPVAVAIEKARLGMHLQIQEKSISPELVETLLALPLRPPFSLVTDDVAADALVERGHLDHVARCAVAAGLPPLDALRAMTLAPASRLRLHDRGSVTPGRRADLVLLPDLESFRAVLVIAGGTVVAREGAYTGPPLADATAPFRDSVRLRAPVVADLAWRYDRADGPVRLRAIRVNAHDTSTEEEPVGARVAGGEVQLPAGVALLAILHRHGRVPGVPQGEDSGRGSGAAGHAPSAAFAPVTGLSLGEGAVATTYAHDSHNLLVLGTSPASMAAAAAAVVEARGGVAVARDGRPVALLPLPIGGLMSDAPAGRVAAAAAAVRGALRAWGYVHENAFMSLSTLSLPVSPRLKLTDRGLVDVDRRAWAVPEWRDGDEDRAASATPTSPRGE